MEIKIKTKATNGHMLIYLINKNDATILTLNENATGSIGLVPGESYDLEWHTWSSNPSTYTIDVSIEPEVADFPKLIVKNYPTAYTDEGVISFTV